MDRFFRTNVKRWDELVDIHAKSEYYDIKAFKAGKSTLHSIELKELGDVSDKSLLHLQCQFGLDTLSWARLGATVTGVDFSSRAIRLAESLSRGSKTPARFICSNIYELPGSLDEDFDIVFTSYGVLCWLPDMDGWAEIVSRFLKNGGIFFVVDFHPFAWIFDSDNLTELKVVRSYFHSEEPCSFEREGTYAEPEADVKNKTFYEWQHSLSDIVNALIKARLKILSIKEYPYCIDQLFYFMRKQGEYWQFSEKDYDFPVMFSLKATK